MFKCFHAGEYLWCKDNIVDVAKEIAKTTTFFKFQSILDLG